MQTQLVFTFCLFLINKLLLLCIFHKIVWKINSSTYNDLHALDYGSTKRGQN